MANDYQSYLQQVGQMRIERANRERVAELQEIQRDWQENVQYRDDAAARGDTETFENCDDACVNLERRWHQLNPPGPPQADPRLVDFIKRNSTYFEKYG